MNDQRTSEELVTQYTRTRLNDMPTHIAEAVREAMYADGYLHKHTDGQMQTFSPFDFMEPEFKWLREQYVRTALGRLETVAVR